MEQVRPYSPIEGDKTGRYVLKGVVLFSLLGVLALAFVYHSFLLEVLRNFQHWVARHPEAGAFAYIGVYALATILAIPGILLTIGAGIIFAGAFGVGLGILVGSAVVFVGATIGAIVAFMLGKTLLRETIAEWIENYPKFKAIDGVIEKNGFKMVALLRLSPLLPFNAFNYMMGVSGVSLRAYALASIGLLPGTIAYVSVGTTIMSLSQAGDVSNNPAILVLTIVGTVVALAASLYISVLAKREIQRTVAKDESQSLEMQENTPNTEISLELDLGSFTGSLESL